MSPVVRRMHTESGLLAALDSGVDLWTAEHPRPGLRPSVRAGATQGTAGSATRSEPTGCPGKGHQLTESLPALPGCRRFLDQELARRWYPRVYFAAPPKTGNHRALADIQESIEELRYYRATVFVEPPGPDSDTARAHAAEHGGSRRPSRRTRWPGPGGPGTDEPVS